MTADKAIIRKECIHILSIENEIVSEFPCENNLNGAAILFVTLRARRRPKDPKRLRFHIVITMSPKYRTEKGSFMVRSHWDL